MRLNKHDYKHLHKFYEDALERYGEEDVRSVQWTSSFGQKRRFDILLGVEDVNGSSLLDAGCGLGDLYALLTEKELNIDYTGIDIIPEFIKVAQKNFPETNFEIKDILEVEEKYDYVLASGALSFKVANNNEHYKRVIKKMYEVANKAVAFNMLDNATHVDNGTYAAYHPKEIAGFCSSFVEHIEVVIDYLPQDFTVYLYK